MADQSGENNPAFKHGHTPRLGKRTREYSIWAGMKTRCSNPKQPSWKRYGGRGIVVCDRWRDSFEAFLADMGPCPSPTHSLDRIDNSKGYEPGNCRWATPREQSHNSANVKMVVVGGDRVPLNEAARRLGIDRTSLTKRIQSGMTPQEAVDRPFNRARGEAIRQAWARKRGMS